MRIAQFANFYSPTSGGLRTCVDELGRGYTALGHERILVVPGPEDLDAARHLARHTAANTRALIAAGRMPRRRRARA